MRTACIEPVTKRKHKRTFVRISETSLIMCVMCVHAFVHAWAYLKMSDLVRVCASNVFPYGYIHVCIY